jgi:hypothetical protein
MRIHINHIEDFMKSAFDETGDISIRNEDLEDELLLKEKVKLINLPQVDGFTPVHYCCHKGSLKLL